MSNLLIARQNSSQQKRIEDLQEKSTSWLYFRPQGEGFPWGTEHAFGIMYISGATVKIKGGEIQIGNEAAVACADLAVVISVDYSKVGYEYSFSAKTLTIKNFGASLNYEDGFFRKWLYRFRLVSSKAYFYDDGILNPSLPSNYGDTPA